MIRIGIFSRISQVPVSKLRYYDEVGLLQAAHIDPATGYRYYQLEQLPRLYRILALKAAGLSLEEIQRLMEAGLPLAELRGMLRLKQAELRQQVQAGVRRLDQLQAWLVQIEQEEVMPALDVMIKKVGPMRVLSVRDTIATYSQQGPLWDELGAYLQRYPIPCQPEAVSVYHQDEPNIEVEVCLLLENGAQAQAPAGGRVQLRELPEIVTAAATVYSGPLESIGDGYKVLTEWIERQGYRIAGPCREVYLRGPDEHSQVDPGVVVEIQVPVEKE